MAAVALSNNCSIHFAKSQQHHSKKKQQQHLLSLPISPPQKPTKLLPISSSSSSPSSFVSDRTLNYWLRPTSSQIPPFFRFHLQAVGEQDVDSPQFLKIAEMEVSGKQTLDRVAVVTGANKGIGLETVRQLACSGVTVVLTARNESRGTAAVSSLHELGLSNVLFHQLNVLDPESIRSLASFIQTRFGKLDILVNNAGASGVVVDGDELRSLNIDPALWLSGKATNMVQGAMKTTFEKAEECLQTNFYGCKRVAEALLPVLQLSTYGGRIVNVSSLRGELWRIPNEEIRKELADIHTLTEEKIEKILERFLHDLKQDALEANQWQKMLPAYSISKATLNAHTRVLATKYPNMCINCVHPGYVDTDINWHTGTMTVEEGAKGSVMLALLPEGGPTGCYFDRTELAEF